MKTITLPLEKLHSKDPKVKYGFVKELLKMGKESPQLLYGYFDHWSKMLTSENNILKWTAIDIIGYLSQVDQDNKTDQMIPDLFKSLHGGQLITCTHAIFSLGLIAQNKPEHLAGIIKELLNVANDSFDSEDCKDIAIGKVLLTFNNLLAEIKDNQEVLTFVKDAQHCQRNATQKKAEKLLARIQKSSLK